MYAYGRYNLNILPPGNKARPNRTEIRMFEVVI